MWQGPLKDEMVIMSTLGLGRDGEECTLATPDFLPWSSQLPVAS